MTAFHHGDNNMPDRLIFHLDINSAFLSWEATRRVKNGESDLRLVPSVIGGDPNKRTSIVAAKSIPAKKYGINTGEPVSMALRKCPSLIVVESDFHLYMQCSRAFKSICQEYTPCMESYSIDEVFMDMTGMEMLYGEPVALATTIKDRIKNELGFTANIGIGRCKVCAKMASDFEKPDKVHTLFPEEIPVKMWPLPVRELFTCGKASANRLITEGIKTIGDLANTPVEELIPLLGQKAAIHLHEYANGIDNEPVSDEPWDAKGYSAETTSEEDIVDISAIEHILLAQADVVATRIRAEGVRCRCVGIKYRSLDFTNHSHQRKLDNATDITEEIYKIARELILERWKGEPLRLIGLSLTDIDRDGFEQLSFFVDERMEKLKKLDSAMDQIRTKYGNDSVQRASILDISKGVNRKYKASRDPD